eukprot:5191031-Prymnesium_polylepis.1
MLPGSRRGPIPTKWRAGAGARFDAYFARRTEPLNSAPEEEEPLAEATGAGLRWVFHEFGEETTQ